MTKKTVLRPYSPAEVLAILNDHAQASRAHGTFAPNGLSAAEIFENRRANISRGRWDASNAPEQSVTSSAFAEGVFAARRKMTGSVGSAVPDIGASETEKLTSMAEPPRSSSTNAGTLEAAVEQAMIPPSC